MNDQPITTRFASTMQPASSRSVLRAGPVLVAAGSEDTAAVLRAGVLIATRLRREVDVVSVVDPDQQIGVLPGDGASRHASVDALVESRRQRIHHEMEVVGAPARWSVRTEIGDVPRALARIVRQSDASFLVMGLGRRRPVERLLGADTVVRTVRQAECPVVAVPRSLSVPPGVAVVGVDFSESALHAAHTMLPLLALGATVHLLHVWQPSNLADEIHAEQDEQYRRELPMRLRHFVDALALPPSVAVRQDVREGRPAERLLEYAEARHADLLVLGRHGRGLFERLLVGGVAQRVIRGAGCAVLVVPEPALHARAREPVLAGQLYVSFERSEWSAKLDEFSRRNAGRVTVLEMSDATRIPCSREGGYVLFGVSYHERTHEVEVILGEANGRRRHLTRLIPDVSSLGVRRDETGADIALRLDHGTGQTLLSIVARKPAAPSRGG